MFLLHNNSQCPKNRQIVGTDLMYSQAVALLGYYLETENWKLCSDNERDSEQRH